MSHHHQFDEALALLPPSAQQKFAQLENLFSHSGVCSEKVCGRMIEVDELVTSVDRRLARGVETEEAERLISERDAARLSYTALVRLRDRHLAAKASAKRCLLSLRDFIVALANDDISVRAVSVDAHPEGSETSPLPSKSCASPTPKSSPTWRRSR